MLASGASKSRKLTSEVLELGCLEFGEAVAGGELEVRVAQGAPSVGVGFFGEEDGDAGDEEGLRQALDDGVDEGAEVGLGVERAAEVDEGFAVVEALLVEDAVDVRLEEALDGLEDEAGGDDGGEQAPDFERLEARVHDFGGDGDDREVEADERGGGEGVGDAALEDEVDVHEAVADDRPSEGERKEDERERDEV